MLRSLLTLCLAVGLAALSAAAASSATAAAPAPQLLMPGVTYEQAVQFTPRGPVALHVVRAPRPGGLYSLRPLLSNDAILGRETVTAMQRRLAPQATLVAVNGDLAGADGRPAGILLRDGALDHTPAPGRSSAGVDAQERCTSTASRSPASGAAPASAGRSRASTRRRRRARSRSSPPPGEARRRAPRTRSTRC